jgi:hypothetical protein
MFTKIGSVLAGLAILGGFASIAGSFFLSV